MGIAIPPLLTVSWPLKQDPRLLPGSCPTPFNWARYTEEEEEKEEEELPVHIFVQHVAGSGPSTVTCGQTVARTHRVLNVHAHFHLKQCTCLLLQWH